MTEIFSKRRLLRHSSLWEENGELGRNLIAKKQFYTTTWEDLTKNGTHDPTLFFGVG